VTRADDERVADIVEAASEIAAIVDAGEEAWESDQCGGLRSSASWKSSVSRRAP
jgi:hypothetical protein